MYKLEFYNVRTIVAIYAIILCDYLMWIVIGKIHLWPFLKSRFELTFLRIFP